MAVSDYIKRHAAWMPWPNKSTPLLAEHLDYFESTFDEHADELISLDGRVDAAEGSITSHTSSISDHETRIGAIEGDNLDTRLTTAETDIIALEGNVNPFLEHTTVADGDVTVLNLQQTCRGVRLEATLITAENTTFDNIAIRFNQDSGANYDYQILTATNTTVAGAEGVAQTSGFVGQAPGANAPGSAYGYLQVDIFDWKRTDRFKPYLARSFYKGSDASGGFGLRQAGGIWRSTSAITGISILVPGGSVGIGTGARLVFYPIP